LGLLKASSANQNYQLTKRGQFDILTFSAGLVKMQVVAALVPHGPKTHLG